MERDDNHLILKIRGKAWVAPGSDITAGLVAEIAGPDHLVTRANGTRVKSAPDKAGELVVVSGLDVVRAVAQETGATRISLHGEDETVVYVEGSHDMQGDRTGTRLLLTAFRVGLIWVVLFVGSGLAIMNFHADVEMGRVLARIYEMITEERVSRLPLSVIVPYSVGIGLGIAVFFNRIPFPGRRREPSPLDIEIYLYDQNVHRCIAAFEEERASKDFHATDHGGV